LPTSMASSSRFSSSMRNLTSAVVPRAGNIVEVVHDRDFGSGRPRWRVLFLFPEKKHGVGEAVHQGLCARTMVWWQMGLSMGKVSLPSLPIHELGCVDVERRCVHSLFFLSGEACPARPIALLP
jgi:hypothetical protein